jgi:hypothetical protein
MFARARAAIVAAGLAALIAVGVVLLTSTQPRALPTVADLHMPVARAALGRTVTVGSKRGVTIGDGTRLDIQSRYGQFRGHWWWNKGWVYVSGQVLPGSRIHVHIDAKSLTITETPDLQGVEQIRRYGPKTFVGDDVEVDVVRLGVGTFLFETRTAGGPFPGRHVVDQLQGRAWSSRGLTITRDQVTSTPANHVPCTLMEQPSAEWNLGCRILGQAPLDSDRRGRFPSNADAVIEAYGISLTATPNRRTQLPTDSVRVDW